MLGIGHHLYWSFGAVAVQKNIRDLEYLKSHSSAAIARSNMIPEIQPTEQDTPLE